MNIVTIIIVSVYATFIGLTVNLGYETTTKRLTHKKKLIIIICNSEIVAIRYGIGYNPN